MKIKKLLVSLSVIVFTVAVGHAQIAKPVVEDVRSSEKTIQGAPFSADAVTESVQILSDGTRITRRSTSKIYRDKEGRYRRDDSRKQLGVAGESVDIAESIMIIDPVSGVRYNLDVEDRTYKQSPTKLFVGKEFNLKGEPFDVKQEEWKLKQATRQAENQARQQEQKERQAENRARQEKQAEKHAQKHETQAENQVKQEAQKQVTVEASQAIDGKDQKVIVKTPPEPKPVEKVDIKTKMEPLGVQNIEGVDAEGTRTTTKIPAGTIGNDRDINIVYEKWYSKELQMTVLSKHNDPRFGEQTYRLSNISRDNPPITLFSPPADYKRDGDKDFRISEPRVPKISIDPKPSAEPLKRKEGPKATDAKPRAKPLKIGDGAKSIKPVI